MANDNAGLILPEELRAEIREEARSLAADEVRHTVVGWGKLIGRVTAFLGVGTLAGVIGFFVWLFVWAPQQAANNIQTQIEGSDRVTKMEDKIIVARAAKLTEIGKLEEKLARLENDYKELEKRRLALDGEMTTMRGFVDAKNNEEDIVLLKQIREMDDGQRAAVSNFASLHGIQIGMAVPYFGTDEGIPANFVELKPGNTWPDGATWLPNELAGKPMMPGVVDWLIGYGSPGEVGSVWKDGKITIAGDHFDIKVADDVRNATAIPGGHGGHSVVRFVHAYDYDKKL